MRRINLSSSILTDKKCALEKDINVGRVCACKLQRILVWWLEGGSRK
jgi:hypothetical protein